jgi:deazaflavin-dependent oxidoreductase (nitroreductase family)
MNPMRSLAIRLGGQPWLPKLSGPIVRVDKLLQQLTGRRITLLTLSGIPELMLTVPDRRTGEPRSSPLVCAPHEHGWVVAGSNWGQDTPPHWVDNLDVAPVATVTFQGHDTVVVPRRATGTERESLWQTMLDTWPNFAKNAERAGNREIPIFVLERRI